MHITYLLSIKKTPSSSSLVHETGIWQHSNSSWRRGGFWSSTSRCRFTEERGRVIHSCPEPWSSTRLAWAKFRKFTCLLRKDCKMYLSLRWIISFFFFFLVFWRGTSRNYWQWQSLTCWQRIVEKKYKKIYRDRFFLWEYCWAFRQPACCSYCMFEIHHSSSDFIRTMMDGYFCFGIKTSVSISM